MKYNEAHDPQVSPANPTLQSDEQLVREEHELQLTGQAVHTTGVPVPKNPGIQLRQLVTFAVF